MEFRNQKELFAYVWETRKHVSQLSGRALLPEGHSLWHWQFLHVLGKGAYGRYKLRTENILLGLPSEHEHQEEFGVFREKRDALRREYYREFYNKEF